MTKAYLVTGGCGFIGSALVRALASSGHRICVVDCLSYAGHRANLQGISGIVDLETINICDRMAVTAVIDKVKPDAILHLAAETHVDRSIDDASPFVQTNIVGTHALLEAARNYWNHLAAKQKGAFRFIHVSTDEVYGSIDLGAVDEDAPYRPRSPYAASKAASNHLVRAWHTTYKFPTVTVLASNNYGPRQHPEKLIPTIIRRAISDQSIPIYGDGSNQRDWIYVDDNISAIRAALKRGETGTAYNVGTMALSSNIEIAQRVCASLDELRDQPLGTHAKNISFVQDRPGHDWRYSVNAARAQNQLGWAPTLSIDEGLKKTVKWYLDNTKWIETVMEGRYHGSRLGLSTMSKT